MANGDITLYDKRVFRAKLLDGQSASHSGVWIEVPPGYPYRSFESSSLEEGATDASVDLMGSNDETKPADATDKGIIKTLTTPPVGVQLYSEINSYRWVKAKKTAGTTPIGTTVVMICTSE